jgi:hypothetical protein
MLKSSCIDTLKTTTPLVNKVLLTWLTNSYVYYKFGAAAAAEEGISKPQGIGYGIGLAFALFIMQGMFLIFCYAHLLIEIILMQKSPVWYVIIFYLSMTGTVSNLCCR